MVVPLTAAVIVTTPQKLAFIDIAEGVRMFSKLKVSPLSLSASGYSGMPEVVADPQSEVAKTFQNLGVCVVQQYAKIRQQGTYIVLFIFLILDPFQISPDGRNVNFFLSSLVLVSTAVTYDKSTKAIRVKVPDSEEEFLLHPATVRRNDRGILLVLGLKQDEWTGEQKLQYDDTPEDTEPEEIRPMGNYAVSITWPDGFNQETCSMFLLQWLTMIFVTILQSD
ncbi:hypothetical protein CRYUN_Cryun02cG0002800 [Craigia yunnanensis]